MKRQIIRADVALKEANNYVSLYKNILFCRTPMSEYDRERRTLACKLKMQAREIGLAYWPALYCDKVDPLAYVAAERVLTPVHGRYGERRPDGSFRFGGWDSYGQYGLSASDAADMWLAAGCKDSHKFRAQVRTGIRAKKGDSLPFFLAYARGKRWIERRKDMVWLLWSRKALAALGRVSPEIREALIIGLAEKFAEREGRRSAIRIRDLNWDLARIARDKIKTGNPRAKISWACPKRAAQHLANILGVDEDSVTERDVVLYLTPQFPLVDVSTAQKITRGMTPRQISGGQLTKKEAVEWLTTSPELSPAEWLQRRLLPPERRSDALRDAKVVRWLAHAAQRSPEALSKRRPIPGGPPVSLIEMIDEITGEDIRTGKDSVPVVMTRARRRLEAVWLAEGKWSDKPLRPRTAWSFSLPPWMRLLNSELDLAREGKEMEHCVGSYASAVKRGQCHILSVHTPDGERSTLELSPDGRRIRQHKGPNNSRPPRRHEQLVAEWLWIRRGQEGKR